LLPVLLVVLVSLVLLVLRVLVRAFVASSACAFVVAFRAPTYVSYFDPFFDGAAEVPNS
jgi:hypothetical protein